MTTFKNTILVPCSLLTFAWVQACGGSSPTPATQSAGAGAGGSVAGTSAGGSMAGTSAGGSVAGTSAVGGNNANGGEPSGGAGAAGSNMTTTGGAGFGAGPGVTTPGPLNPTDCATLGGTPEGTATGTVGTWENVTPKGLDMTPSAFNGDNYGVQDVVVDPVRPSDVYTFVCHQGVWKSTDYGATWNKINTGNNGSEIDKGKPWGSGIDSNRCRDPKTPPTLYTLNGNGQRGFWQSTDGGVSWVRTELPPEQGLNDAQDAYSIAVDPYDGRHILMGFHEAVGMLESNDGGKSWVVHKPGDDGISVYFYFLDTGAAATTRATWLSVGQSGAMWRTTDSGSTWKKVEALQHGHGCSQLFQGGPNLLYAPGVNGSQGSGIYRSIDLGLTWNKVSDGSPNNLVGTAKNLYAADGWANNGGVDPNLQTATRTPGTTWTKVQAPAGMTNGGKGTAVTYDGKHYVVIGGNWNAGIWRYIEP
jgi:hypothetical protein